MKHNSSRDAGSERLIFTLPRTLVAELEKYARALRGGNKSGFVADALRSYIDQYRRRRHTQLLRASYAQAAAAGRAVQRQWEPLDDETWAALEEAEGQRSPRR